MSTSNTNQKKNDKIRPREENSEEEKPNKKQKLGDPEASSEKPKPELPKPVLPFFEEITNIDDFADQVCVPISGSPTKLRKTTTEKQEGKKYSKEELKQILSKDKDNLRVVLGVNQWNQLDKNQKVAVDSINNNAIEGIKEEAKNLRHKVDVIATVLTRMEASNKVYFDTILKTTKKHSEETQELIGLMKAAFTAKK
jgi:hypothetical protein